jgi:DNA-binding NarL/FixJ family response regulator
LRRPIASSHALLVLAATQLELDELPSLARFLDVAACDADDRLGRANAAELGAIVAMRTGEEAAAADLALSAAQTFADLQRPLDQARCLESAGQRSEARALYEKHGATGYAKRAGGLLSAPEPTSDNLSVREREVATFISAGLSNVAIAERMFISKKTVEKHVASIYDKLGVRSRAQVAGLLARVDR